MHYPMIDTHQINFFCIFHFYFAVFVKLSKPKGLEIGKKLGQISHSAPPPGIFETAKKDSQKT